MTKITVDEGVMWEDNPFTIETNLVCSSYGGKPCRHSGPLYRVEGEYDNKWLQPAVVIANNEGGYNSTGVCLDCILEATVKLRGEDKVNPLLPKLSVIHKYPLKLVQAQLITLPQDFRILSVGVQNGAPTLWVQIGDKVPQINHWIKIIATGEEFNAKPNMLYLDTVFIGEHVWHIFIEV